MKILITGATGLIGDALVKLLLQNKHQVHYLTTSVSKIVYHENERGFYWNPLTGEIDKNCIEGVDVIIHLAGASISKRWTKSYKKELIESRIVSANLLFSLLKKNSNQVKHFISASGTAIYPDSYNKIYDETSKEKDDSFLGNLVVRWEEAADQFELLNIKVAKIRTGVVYAKNGGALVEIIKPIKMGFGSGFGSGKQMQSWIHIDDIVNLYYFVIKNKIEGVVNAVSPNGMTNTEQTKIIAKLLKKPLFLPNVPQWIMKLALGDMHILLFNNKTIVPKKVLDLGFTFNYANPEEALKNCITE